MEGTLSVVTIEDNRLVFDASVSNVIGDRQIRIACDRGTASGAYKVKAVAMWPNMFVSGSTQIEWRQVNEVKIPYGRLKPPPW